MTSFEESVWVRPTRELPFPANGGERTCWVSRGRRSGSKWAPPLNDAYNVRPDKWLRKQRLTGSRFERSCSGWGSVDYKDGAPVEVRLESHSGDLGLAPFPSTSISSRYSWGPDRYFGASHDFNRRIVGVRVML